MDIGTALNARMDELAAEIRNLRQTDDVRECGGCEDSENHPHAFDCDRVPNISCIECGYTCTVGEDFYSEAHKNQCEAN